MSEKHFTPKLFKKDSSQHQWMRPLCLTVSVYKQKQSYLLNYTYANAAQFGLHKLHKYHICNLVAIHNQSLCPLRDYIILLNLLISVFQSLPITVNSETSSRSIPGAQNAS